MRDLAELRVECVAEMLAVHSAAARFALTSKAGGWFVCNVSDRIGPSLDFSPLFLPPFHRALPFALCLTVFPTLLSAQILPLPPTSGDAQLQLAQQQGDAETAVLDWVLANSGPLTGDTPAGACASPSPSLLPKAGGTKPVAANSPGMRLPPATCISASSFSISQTDGWSPASTCAPPSSTPTATCNPRPSISAGIR